MVGSDNKPPPPPVHQCRPAAPGLKHPAPYISSREWAIGSGHGYDLGAFQRYHEPEVSKTDLRPLAWSKRGACCKIKGGGLVNPVTRPPIRTGSDRGLRTKMKHTASRGDPHLALVKRKLVFWYQHNKGSRRNIMCQGPLEKASTHF